MPRYPGVHRYVPQPPVMLEGSRVPPLQVEDAVAEAQQLRQHLVRVRARVRLRVGVRARV